MIVLDQKKNQKYRLVKLNIIRNKFAIRKVRKIYERCIIPSIEKENR